MTLPVINFAAIPPQGNPFARDFGDMLQKALMFTGQMKKQQLANQIAQVQAQYAQPMAEQNLIKSQQANEWNPKLWEENVLSQALANQKSEQELPFIKGKEQADINYKNALADFKKMGGGLGGSGSGDEALFHKAVQTYNPHLTDEQLREAADVYAIGGKQLSDGTPLAPMNPTLQRAYDRAFISTTTKPLVTAGVKANQAEAEMPVLDKFITQGRQPYGDTILGYSSKQISDSLNTKDHNAQQRAGKYIASELLNFDKAALATRINGLEPGQNIINESLDKAKQSIKARWPRLTDEARQVALETFGKALKEALKARNKYGISASSATGKNESSNANGTDWIIVNGKLVRK